jgi:5'-deoxynucleotidase YfbR-like HD superfamily hydrolase
MLNKLIDHILEEAHKFAGENKMNYKEKDDGTFMVHNDSIDQNYENYDWNRTVGTAVPTPVWIDPSKNTAVPTPMTVPMMRDFCRNKENLVNIQEPTFYVAKEKGLSEPLTTPEEEALLDSLYQKNEDGWIQTYTGKRFYPLAPEIEDICIEDIAHALSMQCRFTGHAKFHYSIAQHSVLVSYLCDSADRKAALIHDFSEAFCSDISSPLKKLDQLSGYREIEMLVQNTICDKFGVSRTEPQSVKEADHLAMAIEAKTLLSTIYTHSVFDIEMPPVAITRLLPEEAEKLLLNRFRELFY